MSEHVLVVGSGRDMPARVRAARPGTRTSVICRLEFVAKLRQVTEHSRVLAVRHDAPDTEWISLARAAHTADPFTRIATFGETDQDRCAAIGAALGLTTHTPRTVTLVHDKEAMRAALREAGVDPTPSALVGGVDELDAFVADHGLPCIVKPVDGAGSAGVTAVRALPELGGAFERAGDRVLVERLHEGPQFSVESFSEAGEHQVVAITGKFSDPETMVELGHVVPAALGPVDRECIAAFVPRVLDALGIEFGATHTEVVLTADGPRVIETHVRMGGDEIGPLVHDATGVDLNDFVVRQTVGEKVLPHLRERLGGASEGGASGASRAAAIWFAAPPAVGTLVAIDGLERASGVEGVTDVQALVKPGGAIGVLRSSDDRVAYARAVAPTGEAAVRAAREAVSLLDFQIRARAAIGPTV